MSEEGWQNLAELAKGTRGSKHPMHWESGTCAVVHGPVAMLGCTIMCKQPKASRSTKTTSILVHRCCLPLVCCCCYCYRPVCSIVLFYCTANTYFVSAISMVFKSHSSPEVACRPAPW